MEIIFEIEETLYKQIIKNDNTFPKEFHYEIDCRKCKNCTGESCKKYGNNADIAVESCADDRFKNYKERDNYEDNWQ